MALALVLVCHLALLAGPAAAQDGIFEGMQKSLDSVFSSTVTTTTFASGLATKTTTRNIYPSLNLNIDSLLFPKLRLNAGGVFEVNLFSTTTLVGEADSTISRNRPFFLLRSTDPIFSPGFGYFRREDRSRSAGSPGVKLVNDEWAGYLRWNPTGGPMSDIQLLRTRTFDEERTSQDVLRHFGTLVSNYSRGSLTAYYRGAYARTEDRIRSSTPGRSPTQGAQLLGLYIRKRLTWNGTYNVNRQDISSTAGGNGGEVPVPLIPFAGLSALSDTPITAKLAPNPALIDGNLTAGRRHRPGADDPARGHAGPEHRARLPEPCRRQPALGVGGPVAAVRGRQLLLVGDLQQYRQRALAARGAVPVAPFEPFENRFEVDFPHRHGPVRQGGGPAPVAGGAGRGPVPGHPGDRGPAFRQAAGGHRPNELSQTTHFVNADARMRILDAAGLFYEGFYVYNGPDLAGRSTSTLSNGLSVNRTFARIFSAYGRAAFEQGEDPRGDRTATVTNATLTVDPIPAFRSSVLYTGQDERINGVPLGRRGVMLQNAAQLYRGVDVLVGIGWNSTTREAGEVSHDRLVNVSATVVPRQHISFTISYDGTTTDYSGALAQRPQTHVRAVVRGRRRRPDPDVPPRRGRGGGRRQRGTNEDDPRRQRELDAVPGRRPAVDLRHQRGDAGPGVRKVQEPDGHGAVEPLAPVVHRHHLPKDEERVRRFRPPGHGR